MTFNQSKNGPVHAAGLWTVTRRAGFAVAMAATLSGCSAFGFARIGRPSDPNLVEPIATPLSRTGAALMLLPAAARKVDIAVYDYADKTGQNEPADNFSRFSKAVTQGGDDVLVDVLSDVGGGSWFNVVERAGLQELLTERQLIDQTNQQYRGTTSSQLPPLRYAGVIIRGGVIDYDENVATGGFGARILGVGVNTEYREDRVSVALRAVSVATGDVLASVTTDKTVYSIKMQDSVFRYVAMDKILELDAGISQNEPTGLAVRQAIELAVYALIIEGAEKDVWSFTDRSYQSDLIRNYRERTLRTSGDPRQIIAQAGGVGDRVVDDADS